MSTPPAERPLRIRRIFVFAAGTVMGVASFALSMAVIPSHADPSDHDLQLANNLGFIFAPLVGFWVGIVRRSLAWLMIGLTVGLVLGAVYRLLCGYNFLAVMVAYPCLLGGAASAALGTRDKYSWDSIARKLFKGLIAGFVLGFTYMFVLNALAPFWLSGTDFTAEDYHHAMWIAGSVAMALASGLFLLLFHWSAELDG